jgi:hypothetical protein
MSELSSRMIRGSKLKPDQEVRRQEPEQEQAALRKLRVEAREAGATLATGGKGGLPSSLVLGVMRRDKYRCKVCGGSGRGNGEGGLSIHHKSEHLENPKALDRSKLMHKEDRVNSPANLVTLCAKCHDKIHEKDREEYGDGPE